MGLCKIEEILKSLTSVSVIKDDKSAANKILDDRSFTEIVDRVMPKEVYFWNYYEVQGRIYYHQYYSQNFWSVQFES